MTALGGELTLAGFRRNGNLLERRPHERRQDSWRNDAGIGQSRTLSAGHQSAVHRDAGDCDGDRELCSGVRR
jgi:hypothetical protein